MFGGASSTSEVAAEYNRDDGGDDDGDEGADIASRGLGGAGETKAEARVADSATRRIVRFFAIVRNL
jgi:hypothetical protein